MSRRIQQPYTLAEIKAKIASHDYSAELLLQHAMLLLEKPAPEDIRSILVRCREFIDTTKIPAYPAGADLADEIDVLLAAQPAPAPLSEMPCEKRKAIQEGEQIGASDAWFKARHEMLDTLDRRNVFRAGFDRGWNAALAAQGGK